MDLTRFWRSILEQNRNALATFFCPDAIIRWHCTNEQFTAPEFTQANCEYLFATKKTRKKPKQILRFTPMRDTSHGSCEKREGVIDPMNQDATETPISWEEAHPWLSRLTAREDEDPDDEVIRYTLDELRIA